LSEANRVKASAGRDKRRTSRDPAAINPEAEILRPKAAARFLGLGDTLLWQTRRSDPTFPPVVRLGVRAIGFRRSDLLAWIEARQA
jgi:prophage regulatory protein